MDTTCYLSLFEKNFFRFIGTKDTRDEAIKNCKDLFSRYKPVDILKSGGSATIVIKAKYNEEYVVLKLFNFNYTDGFDLEYRVTSRLMIPNTLRPLNYEIFLKQSFGIIIFPYLDDFRHCESASCDEWKYILMQLLETIIALNKEKYSHLDIKPSNVILQGYGKDIKVTLIDFESVTFMNFTRDFQFEGNPDLAEVADFSGTIPFVDPIYMLSDCPHIKSDVWSIGIMLLRDLTYYEFDSLEETDYLRECLRLSPAIIAKKVKGLELGALVIKMLAINWNDRCSAEEARDFLLSLE